MRCCSIVVLTAVVSAVYAQVNDPCQTKYDECVKAGTLEIACSCDLTACLGEDAARIREWCASATAGLVSTTSSATVSIVTGTIVQPSGAPQITAPAGSVPLGKECGADEQCGAGVQCWGSTAGTIRACGNFNAACTQDSQCAYNTCNNGLCNGFLESSAYPANTNSAPSASSLAPGVSYASAPVPTPKVISGNATTVAPTGSTRPGAPSSSLTAYTGGASVGATLSGFAALAAGFVAYIV